jgi:exodeoxyribonuclease VII large subunit
MTSQQRDNVYSVSELNRLARQALEQDLPLVWVAGEISNLARPASGHLYFSLKDERAQVRCAMFRGANRGLRFVPGNGDQVLARGRVSIYEPRGEFQLIVEHLEAAGEGLLRRRLEELKQRLAAEGLFSAERKQPLPALPQQIGVVTSPTGAAIRDILHVLARRFPAIPVVVYPVPVQGAQASGQIAAALATAAARAECDVLILARGGGSLEDLWAFNEEILVRAIVACPIPIVTGVGHEIDFTLADFAADVRAPTPSAAAELVVPDQRAWLRQLADMQAQLRSAVVRRIAAGSSLLVQLGGRLSRSHPGYMLRQNEQRLDELRQRLTGSMQHLLAMRRLEISGAASQLRAYGPAARLGAAVLHVGTLHQRLGAATARSLQATSSRLAVAAGRLQAISPLATLGRGYAIVQDAAGGIVRDAGKLQPGDTISARLARGTLTAKVSATRRE